MRLSGHFAEMSVEQRLLRAEVTVSFEGVELALPPAPKAAVDAMRDWVQAVRSLSLLRAVRKVLQLSLMPEGMRGLAVAVLEAAEDADWASAAEASKEIIASDLIIAKGSEGKRVDEFVAEGDEDGGWRKR
jgi:hypothetical protein